MGNYRTGLFLFITMAAFAAMQEPPEDPPVMYDSNDRPITAPLNVRENQTVTIKCQINGGRPKVYATVITCLSHQRRELHGHVIFIDIAITPGFHNKSCSCYGKHLTGYTRSVSVAFLVLSSPKITSFTLDGQQSARIWKNMLIDMACKATGYPMPMLSIVYNQGEKKKLKLVASSEISLKMNATCQTMGEYICLAENNDQQKDTKSVNLRVQCAPEYYPSTEETPKFEASMGSNKTVKLRVLAYPAPTLFILSKGDYMIVRWQKYRAHFKYTDETSGRGEITVTILSVDRQDFGSYQLFSQFWKEGYYSPTSHLHFELLAPVPPICPKNLRVSATFSDSITLSWKPGFDGGLQQSFTILRYGSGLTTEPQTVSVIPQPAGSLEDEMSYTVTGLSWNTTYTFALRAENEEGVENCTLQVQGSTIASPSSSSDHSPNILTPIVVIVVFVLVLVITVVVLVFVLVGRRRSRGLVLYTETVLTPTRLGRSSSRDNERVAYETIDDTVLIEGVLNTDMVQTATSNGKPSVRNEEQNAYETANGEWLSEEVPNTDTDQTPASNGRPSNRSEEQNAYETPNGGWLPEGQGKSKVNNPRQEDTYEGQQDNTYAQVVKENKKKGKKQKRIEGDENNGAVMYANTSNYVTMNPRQAVADEVYANVAGASKARQEKPSPAADDGRTVNQDGLIYTEVMTNAKATSPKMVKHGQRSPSCRPR